MKLTGENRRTCGKPCPSATLFNANPTWMSRRSIVVTYCIATSMLVTGQHLQRFHIQTICEDLQSVVDMRPFILLIRAKLI
jgi:hypothetical protein